MRRINATLPSSWIFTSSTTSSRTISESALLDDAILDVVLQPRHEEDLLPGQLQPPVHIRVATIEHQHRAWLKPLSAGHLDLRGLARSHYRKLRQVAVMVQHQVQLHRPLAAAVQRPVEDAQTQRDHGRVQTEQLVFEAELPLATLCRLRPAALIETLEHGLEQRPWTVLVGVGQRGALRRGIDAQVAELPFAGRQSAGDLAQCLRMPQLAKQHRNELGPAAKATCVALSLMLSYSGLKLQAGELLQHLRENAAYSIHGGGLLRLLSVLPGTNTTYQSRRLLIPQQLIWTSLDSRRPLFRRWSPS